MIRSTRIGAVLGAVALAACLGGAPVASAASAGCGAGGVTPIPPTATNVFGVTAGPGGTWYSDGDRIVRVRPDGAQDVFLVPDPDQAWVGWLSWSGGRDVWFSDRGTGRLGRIDGTGHVVEYQVPGEADGAGPNGQVEVNGRIWFSDPFTNRIGQLNPVTGRFVMYDVPTPDSWPLGITAGPDGAIWFTEREAAKVGRMTPAGGFTEWSLDDGAFPNRIVVGPDGAIWFTELYAGDSGRVGRIANDTLTETAVDGGPVGITVGPDGDLYVALWLSSQLGRLDSAGHLARTWDVPGALIVGSSQGALWLTDPFTDAGGSVTRVRPNC
jgi:virginiamycin B lyase